MDKNGPSAPDDQRGALAWSARLETAAFDEFIITGVIKKRRLRYIQRTPEKRQGLFSDPALSPFDIADLILRKPNPICKLQLAQSLIQTKPFDADSEIGLNDLHGKKCGDVESLRTPSVITGYDLCKLGFFCACGFRSGEKSKKSRTGTPSVIEKASIDSKEGAFSPLSIRLKKSIEISKNSANCS